MPRFDPDDIRDAIEDELAETQESVIFDIVARERTGDCWSLHLALSDRRQSVLDESLEGQSAWWPGPPKGAADVLSVVPEEQCLNLRFATVVPPGPGERLFVFAPRYLEPLLNAWRDESWVSECEAWVKGAWIENRFDVGNGLAVDGTPVPLRLRQREAFELTGWNCSYLWGPPGTGKTYTLGAVLAAYLMQRPTARVLLLSTTNVAVDEALVSVDNALSRYGHRASAVQRQCRRVGNHFVGSKYVGREHLLPVRDPGLVRRLAELQSKRPDPASVTAYAEWKSDVESIRARLKATTASVLGAARLAAMTTTGAAFALEQLRMMPRYDLVVFDEASQIGLAHAIALAPLARKAVFAGDPQQLSPIVQSNRDAAKRWLGQSPFCCAKREDRSTCRLNEQSRMAAPICEIVSTTFYDGDLIVAADAQRDHHWLEYRRTGAGHLWDPPNIWVERALEDTNWSQLYGGPIRYSSTQWVVDHLDLLLGDVDEEDVLILTPFRAQRTLLRKRLQGIGVRRLNVSTIHRAQGSEKHTIVFDAVDGASDFFAELGDPLINVAISRAQARLVLLLTERDLKNEKLAQISEFVRLRQRVGAQPNSAAVPSISEWTGRADFPNCVVGKLVSVGGVVGEVVQCDASLIYLRDILSGQLRRFQIEFVRSRFPGRQISGTDGTKPRSLSASGEAAHADTTVVRRAPTGERLVRRGRARDEQAVSGANPAIAAFYAALKDLCLRIHDATGEDMTATLRFVDTVGAVAAVERLLTAPAWTSAPGDRRRPHYSLTVDYLVLDERWSGLFADRHRELARRRLADMGWSFSRTGVLRGRKPKERSR